MAFCGRIVGVALNCLMSCGRVSGCQGQDTLTARYLFECLVIDEAGGVLWDIELALL